MATDYGTDIRALTDLPLRDDLVSGEENLAYAEARRLLTPTDGYADCGDSAAYESLDLRQQIGARIVDADLDALKADAQTAIAQDERGDGPATVTIERVGGDLVASVDADAGAGPFDLVTGPDGVTLAILED